MKKIEENDEDEIVKVLSDRIKLLRGKSGLTQDELVARSGVSKSGLQGIEYQTSKSPEVITVKKLANAMGYTVSEAIGEGISPQTRKSELIIDIITLLPNLDEEQLRTLRSNAIDFSKSSVS